MEGGEGRHGDDEEGEEQKCEVFRAARVVVALRLNPAPAGMAGASPHDDWKPRHPYALKGWSWSVRTH